MELTLDVQAGRTRIALSGEMTIYAAAEIKDRLIAPIDAAESVEIDLDGVSDFDSSGLQLLVLARRHAAASGKALRLLRPSQAVTELVGLYQLAPFFDEDPRDDAGRTAP